MARALSFVRFNSCQIERYSGTLMSQKFLLVFIGSGWQPIYTKTKQISLNFHGKFTPWIPMKFRLRHFQPAHLDLSHFVRQSHKKHFHVKREIYVKSMLFLVFQSEWFDLFGIVCRRRFGFIWNSRPQRYHIATTTCDNPMRIRLWPRDVEQFPMI